MAALVVAQSQVDRAAVMLWRWRLATAERRLKKRLEREAVNDEAILIQRQAEMLAAGKHPVTLRGARFFPSH